MARMLLHIPRSSPRSVSYTHLRAHTLEELGKEFNVTRERVRQIEAKALRKLRHPSRAKRLRDYLDE